MYSTNTLCRALYSLDVYAYDLNEEKNELIKEKKITKEKILDLKFCYNLKILAMEKLIKQKKIIFQNTEIVRDDAGKGYLYACYRSKNGMPFRKPANKLDIQAAKYSYFIDYPEYFYKPNTLEPFYDFQKSVKVLLKFVNMSVNHVKYMNIS